MFCFWHRWKIDRAMDEGGELESATRQHLDQCDDCHAHHAEQEQLVILLRQHEPMPEPPPFLRESVMNAIRASEAAAEPRWAVPVWVPVAACAVMAFLLMPEDTPRTAEPTSSPTIAEAAPAPAVDLPAVELPTVDMARTLEQVQETIAKPYTKEIESLQNDLKAVGGYMGELFNLKIASRE